MGFPRAPRVSYTSQRGDVYFGSYCWIESVCFSLRPYLSASVSEEVIWMEVKPRVGDWQRHLDGIRKLRKGFMKAIASNPLCFPNI